MCFRNAYVLAGRRLDCFLAPLSVSFLRASRGQLCDDIKAKDVSSYLCLISRSAKAHREQFLENNLRKVCQIDLYVFITSMQVLIKHVYTQISNSFHWYWFTYHNQFLSSNHLTTQKPSPSSWRAFSRPFRRASSRPSSSCQVAPKDQ